MVKLFIIKLKKMPPKIPAGLAQYPDVTPTPNLAWTPTKTSWTNYVKDINPAFLESVNISVLGSYDPKEILTNIEDFWFLSPYTRKEPAGTMNIWW